MPEVKVDPVVFWERIMKLHKTWNNGREKEGLFKGADALAVVTGSANDYELYSKSASLHHWLLGYVFPDTCIVIGNRSITILTSSKKVQYLQPLVEAENATLPLELIASEKKSADKNKSKYEQLVSAIKSSHSGVIVGCLVKEKPQGEFATLWKTSLEEDTSLEQVELTAALADIMAAKDATERQVELNAALADIMAAKDATEQFAVLGKKTYLDHAFAVKKVGEHQMYVFVFKGAFAFLAVVIGTFHSTSFGQEMMAKAEERKVELFISLMTLFTGSVAVLWSLYPA